MYIVLMFFNFHLFMYILFKGIKFGGGGGDKHKPPLILSLYNNDDVLYFF